jgi:hypothetical protein
VRALAVAFVSILMLSLAACGATATVPAVTGLRLNAAYEQLDAAKFTKVLEKQGNENPSTFNDSDWVVVGQEPPAGTTQDPGAAVTLELLRYDDKNLRSKLDSSSPVVAELDRDDAARRANEAADAQRKRDEAAADAQRKKDEAAAEAKARQDEARAYVDSINSSVSLTNRTIRIINDTSRTAASHLAATQANALAASDFFGTAELLFRSTPSPDWLNTRSRLADAQLSMAEAQDLLVSFTASPSQAAKARFLAAWNSAVSGWRAAVTDTYRAAGLPPRLP